MVSVVVCGRAGALAAEAKRAAESAAARADRRRHLAILERSPGTDVEKRGVARWRRSLLPGTCRDPNGFERSCTGTVSTGRVAGHTSLTFVDGPRVTRGVAR